MLVENRWASRSANVTLSRQLAREPLKKKIALVAHESQLSELLDWAKFNSDLLAEHDVYATDTNVDLLNEELGFDVLKFQNGPSDEPTIIKKNVIGTPIDLLVFFWTDSESLPDDPEIQALLQIATSKNVPIAANRTAADFMFPFYLLSPE